MSIAREGVGIKSHPQFTHNEREKEGYALSSIKIVAALREGMKGAGDILWGRRHMRPSGS